MLSTKAQPKLQTVWAEKDTACGHSCVHFQLTKLLNEGRKLLTMAIMATMATICYYGYQCYYGYHMLLWLPYVTLATICYHGYHMLLWLPYVTMATICYYGYQMLLWLPYVKLFGVLLSTNARLSVFIQVDFVQKVQDLSLKVNLTTRLSTLVQCL